MLWRPMAKHPCITYIFPIFRVVVGSKYTRWACFRITGYFPGIFKHRRLSSLRTQAEACLCGRTPACHAINAGSIATGSQDVLFERQWHRQLWRHLYFTRAYIKNDKWIVVQWLRQLFREFRKTGELFWLAIIIGIAVWPFRIRVYVGRWKL